MRKSTRIVKRALALFLVVLMSINSLGAVVSDNDGSAFITKAEFDSLKNDFQSQIDQYNTSIDAKIDGAIASYLAGINVVTTREYAPLVQNYDSIKWLNDLKFYGQYIKWNSMTNREYLSSGDEWYVPNLGERRMQITNRNNKKAIILWDVWQTSDYAKCALRIPLNIVSMGGLTYQSNWGLHNDDDANESIPTGSVKMYNDSNIGWVIDSNQPFGYAESMINTVQCQPHTVEHSGTTGHSWWHYYGGGDYILDNFRIESLNPGDLFRYKLDTLNGGYSAGNERHEVTSVLTANNVGWPNVGYYRGLKISDSPWSDRLDDFKTKPASWADTPSTWFRDGVSLCLMHAGTTQRQYNVVKNMMLGTDFDTIVNLYKVVQKTPMNYVIETGGDTIGDTGNGEILVNASQIHFSAAETDYHHQHVETLTGLSSVTGSFSVPYLPRDHFRNLTTAVYSYKNKAIKIGEGLILVDDVDESGNLKLSFDYKIGNIINDDVYTTSQDLYFDLKKSDFLTVAASDDEYYEGYIGDVSVEHTTEVVNRFKNFKYPERNGKVSITVPVEKSGSIYIRLHPSNDDGGYYVQLSNLKMIYFTED